MTVNRRNSIFSSFHRAACILLVACFVLPSLGQFSSSTCQAGCSLASSDRVALLGLQDMNSGVVKSDLGPNAGGRVFLTRSVAPTASNPLPNDGILPCNNPFTPSSQLRYPQAQFHALQLGLVSCNSAGLRITVYEDFQARQSFCSIQFTGLADIASTMRVEMDFSWEDPSVFSSFETISFTMTVPAIGCTDLNNCTFTANWATGAPDSSVSSGFTGIKGTGGVATLGAGAIVGIVLGSLVFVFLFILFCCKCRQCCCFKQKNRQPAALSYPSASSSSAYTTPSYLQPSAAAITSSTPAAYGSSSSAAAYDSSSSDSEGAGIPAFARRRAAADESSSSSSSSIDTKTKNAKRTSTSKKYGKKARMESSSSSSSSDSEVSVDVATTPAFLTSGTGSTSTNHVTSTLKSLVVDDSSEGERRETVKLEPKKSTTKLSPATLKSMYMDDSSGEEQREDVVERQPTTAKAPGALRAIVNDDSSEEERRDAVEVEKKPVYSIKYSAKDYKAPNSKDKDKKKTNDQEKTEASGADKDEQSDPALKAIKFCMNCASESMNSVLKPCGHSVLCFGCAMEVMSSLSPKCPFCSKKVQSTLQK